LGKKIAAFTDVLQTNNSKRKWIWSTYE